MQQPILSSAMPAGLVELKRLGRTLKQRTVDVTRTLISPTESINGRLEYLHGSDLGIRNLTHYIVGCLLESVGFRPVQHSQLRRAGFSSEHVCFNTRVFSQWSLLLTKRTVSKLLVTTFVPV